MIRIAVVLALLGAVVGVAQAGGTQLSVTGTVNLAYSPKRVAVVHVRTVPGAKCTLADALTGRAFRGTATNGRMTWRWRPSFWANGPDTVRVRCAKGTFHRSTEIPLVFFLLHQIHVLRDYALHIVYWAPQGDMPTDLPAAVSQFEGDVKAALDEGATDNPFAIPRGYGDSVGKGDPRIASIDSTTAADPYPPKPASGYCQGESGLCLGLPDLEREAARLARRHGWPAGNRSLIMIFTSPSATSCFQPGACTRSTEPCGFHWLTKDGHAYTDEVMSCGDESADVGYAIAVIAHEQNEAVVDPQGAGGEIADPCEGQFADVVINGHTYYLPAIEQPSTKCSFAYTP